MKWKSNVNPAFRNQFGEDIFNQKYRHDNALTWDELAETVVKDVCCGGFSLYDDDQKQLTQYIKDMKFIPAGRYLFYAGKKRKFFNNCFMLKALEDSREDWAELSKKTELCLSTGGGVGINFDIYRASGSMLHGTGGVASGPIAKIHMINEIGRCIIQGGSRRSALYASLGYKHNDVDKFIKSKNWYDMPAGTSGLTLGQLKEQDFNFPAPLDMTNISVNFDTDWLMNYWSTGEIGNVFKATCRQALSTGEPGFSFNFFEKETETLRNACTEVTSSDDSDVCNLGSINLSRISTIGELKDVVRLGTMFLLAGTLVAELPYDKVKEVRAKNRRLGLGIMGVHEWLLMRGYKYEMVEEFHRWLAVYRDESRKAANDFSVKWSINTPVACRAIAPTGTIGILAGTTTGIEPIYAVAYKRRYLKGNRWHHQFVIDAAAETLIQLYGLDPQDIETSLDLSTDVVRRIKLQANVQDYVDQAISSTINLPRWGSDENNEDRVAEFSSVLASHAHRLRGFTVYPSGARGGQPITKVDYKDAVAKEGIEEFVDICDIVGAGTCGV